MNDQKIVFSWLEFTRVDCSRTGKSPNYQKLQFEVGTLEVGVTPEAFGRLSTLEFGGVTPEALGRLPGTLEFGAVTLEAVTEFKAGGTILTGALNAVELEKSAGVEVGVELEVSGVGVLEGERLVVVTPNVGVLTLEGSEALVMAVLELGVDALETGGVTGVAGGFEGLVTLEVGGVTGVAGGVGFCTRMEDGGWGTGWIAASRG
jgi:hypothetical protein